MGALAIHHLGFAVQDLDAAVETYERLFGAALEDRAAGEGMEAVTMLVGPDRIELLSSDDAETPIGKFLTKRGPGMHHVAYAVDDIRDELRTLADAGVELIDPEPRRGLFGHEIAFAHPDSVHGVLTELIGSNGG
jgi:methylmalonyl-CoA/ethylmalonyl-CoA epimerase